MKGSESNDFDFDVAISFAGEDRRIIPDHEHEILVM